MNLLRFLKRNPKQRKVFVIGLDCAAPELVSHRWRDQLPNLTRLAQGGVSGELASCTPAITVPAWSSMLSSRDPGVLGIYGFRNRADFSYDKLTTANGSAVKRKRVWDYLSDAQKTSVVLGVPQTYPVRPLNGYLASCFLTPTLKNEFAYPPSFKQEILEVAPDYDFDVRQFRTDNKDWLLQQIQDMTEKRFRVIDSVLTSKPWDFFMFVEIGVDRIHHGFWSYHDPEHFRYEAGNKYENAIRDYYIMIDGKIGEWLAKLDDDTVVLVVSDHGAKRMDGGICLNEWLWRNGYLAFKTEPEPDKLHRLEDLEIDWEHTTAWGSGGYYGRVFLNVQGREPHGVIPAAQYEAVRDELAAKLCAIPDHNGHDIGTTCFKPNEIYQQVNGVAPDLIVYFGDLYWRAVGTIGYNSMHTFDNDTGPDDCNHAQNGMVILYDPRATGSRRVKNAQLMDIAPTILDLMGVPVPADFQGQLLAQRVHN